MSSENFGLLGNSIGHNISLSIIYIIGLGIVVSVVIYSFIDQNRNIKKKILWGKILLGLVAALYFIRFGAIFIVSNIYSVGTDSSSGNSFVDVLRFLQLLVLAIMPTFSIIQARIYDYQAIIKQTSGSAQNAFKWRKRGIISTVSLVLILQIIISLF